MGKTADIFRKLGSVFKPVGSEKTAERSRATIGTMAKQTTYDIANALSSTASSIIGIPARLVDLGVGAASTAITTPIKWFRSLIGNTVGRIPGLGQALHLPRKGQAQPAGAQA